MQSSVCCIQPDNMDSAYTSSLTTFTFHMQPDDTDIAYASSLTILISHMQPSCQCCLQAKLDMFVAMQQLLQQATGPAWSDFAGCSEKLVQIMLEHIGMCNKTCCLASFVVFPRGSEACTLFKASNFA